jgi:hypothetical protein
MAKQHDHNKPISLESDIKKGRLIDFYGGCDQEIDPLLFRIDKIVGMIWR